MQGKASPPQGVVDDVHGITQLLQVLAESTSDALFAKDLNGRYLYCNGFGSRFIGNQIEQIVGNDDVTLFGPDVARPIQDQDRRIIASGRPETFDHQITIDGSPETYRVTKSPHRDAAGKIIGLIVIARNVTSVRNTEQQLRESKRHLAEAQRIARIGSWGWDPSTDRVWWSDAIYSILGLDPRTTIPSLEAFLSILHPDDRPVARRRVADVLAGADGFANDLRVIRTDGTEIWIHSQAQATRDSAGKILRVEGTDQEITERKLTELKLRLTQTTIDNSVDSYYWIDSQGKILRANPAAWQALGYPMDELIGKSVWEIDPNFPQQSWQAHWRELQQQRSLSFQSSQVTSDGRRLETEIRATLIQHDGQEYNCAVVRDVTELRRMVESLRTSESRLRLSVQASQIGLWDWDLRTNEIHYSPDWKSLIGYREDELPNQPEGWQKWIHPDDVESAFRNLRSYVSAPQGQYQAEFRMRHQDGNYRSFRTQADVVRDETGVPVRMLGCQIDITDRIKADRILRDREQLLGIVTSSARAGLVVISDQYEFLFVNQAYADIVGLSIEAIEGKQIPALFPQFWDVLKNRLDTALAGKRVEWEVQFPPDRPIPEARWLRAMYEPRLDPEGRTTVVAVVIDITDQKLAEQEVRLSEEKYRSLMEVLPAAVLIKTDGRISYCNPFLSRLLGFESPDHLIGKTPFEIYAPEFHDQIRQRMDLILKTQQPFHPIEVRLRRVDGSTIPVTSVATPITYAGRTDLLVVLTDLTERERSFDFLRSVLTSLNDVLITIDEWGTIILVSHSIQNMFGYEREEVVGQHLRLLMPEPYASTHDEAISSYILSRISNVLGKVRELIGKKKDGTLFPIELTVTEFLLNGRRHFTGIVRDISDRRKLEDQLRQSQKMEAVGRLAGGVAHDFNNLLTVINGYSEMVLMQSDPENPIIPWISEIRDAGDRASRMTRQLLSFSRKAIIEPKLINLNELVEELVSLLTRLIGENIRLRVITDPKLSLIMADIGQLEQVIMNLVVNARDAMPDGGNLSITTTNFSLLENQFEFSDLPLGNYVQLTVSDTGIGIRPEEIDLIFEPFFTTKKVGEGTGLGLSVVHGVVKQEGGGIHVESTPGAGTTFRILFPAAEQAEKSLPAHGELESVRGSETILLVEDDDAVRDVAEQALSAQGYQVLCAQNGTEALRIAEEHRNQIQLIVTDVVMPELGGLDLAESIRAKHPRIAILYVSGYTGENIARREIDALKEHFLQKPFTPLGLARKVRSLLDGRSL